ASAAYYRWLLTGPHEAVFLVHARGVGGVGDARIDGFIVGGRFRDAMAGFVVRNKLLLTGGVLRHPQLLRSAVGRQRLSIGARAIVGWAQRVVQGSAASPPAMPMTYRCLALAVLPDAQGCGVGQALMAGLDAAAAASGVRRIQLGVDPANRR